MVHKHQSDDTVVTPAYAGRLGLSPVPKHRLPDDSSSPEQAATTSEPASSIAIEREVRVEFFIRIPSPGPLPVGPEPTPRPTALHSRSRRTHDRRARDGQ